MLIRTKLLIALVAMLLLCLVAAIVKSSGARSSSAKMDRILGKDFAAYKIANSFGARTIQLEAEFLPKLIAAELEPGYPDSARFDSYKTQYQSDLAHLRELMRRSIDDDEDDPTFKELAEAVDSYLKEYDKLFDEGLKSASLEDRDILRKAIVARSQNVSLPINSILGLLEKSFSDDGLGALTQFRNSTNLLTGILISCLLIGVAIYFLVFHRIINPLAELTDSVREVQQQNFDLIVPVRSQDEIGALASAFNDMSAELRVMKKEADHEISRLDLERQAIVSGMPHPVFILREDGEISQANPAAKDLLKDLRLENSLPQKVQSHISDAIENQSSYLPGEVNEALLLRRDEVEYWYLPRIFPLEISDPIDFSGWAVELVDVTKVRWLDDLKSDILGTVSHEIKTPITSIRMALHLLAEQKIGDLNKTQSKMVNSAKDECERLLETLKTLLHLSRHETGQPDLPLAPVSPDTLINNAAKQFEREHKGESPELELSMEKGLPHVLADEHRIGQVLSNFLNNAINHGPEGDSITLQVKSSGEQFIRFSVIDTGAGIAPDEQDRIFDRFYKADSDTGPGIGMGLWISREIIRAHEGQIGVTSSRGEVTEFYFDLPLSSK